MRTVAAMEWIRRAGDYRVLMGKRDRLGCALGAEEEARLEELTRFFSNDANRRRLPFASREQIRTAISMVVQFGQTQGQARDISGDGMFVETGEPLPVGSRVVVRVTEEPEALGEDDPAAREQWQFAAEVVRVESDGMGLRFVGIPIAMRISHRRVEDMREPAAPAEVAVDASVAVDVEIEDSAPVEVEIEDSGPVPGEVGDESSGPVPGEVGDESSGPNVTPLHGGDGAHVAA
jgi:hypothetical protein